MASRKQTRRARPASRNAAVPTATDAKLHAGRAIRQAKRTTRAARRQGSAASRAGKRAIADAKRATKLAKRRASGATRSGKRAIARAKALVKETERSTRRLTKSRRSRKLPKIIVRKLPKTKPKQHAAKRAGKKLINTLRRRTRGTKKRKLFIVKRSRRPAKTLLAGRTVTRIRRRRIRPPMRFFSDGEIRSARVRRRAATDIGRYMNAVRQFLPTGDIELLAPFEGKSIADASGKRFRLETRPDVLYALNADPEGFEEIYEPVA